MKMKNYAAVRQAYWLKRAKEYGLNVGSAYPIEDLIRLVLFTAHARFMRNYS